jgi:hypothetical protein
MKTKRIYAMALTMMGGVLLCPSGNSLLAQDSTAVAPQVVNSPQGGGEKFLLAGEVFTLWQNNQVKGAPSTNSFGADPLGLMLMPLVKLNDRFFLDVQVEIAANPGPGGGAAINLNEAIIYYKVAPALYLFAGNFQPRWGLYEGILDDFTNRYCSDPIGMGLGAQTESGIGIQGGFQAGYSKLSYQFYIANGPQLVVDSSGAANGQMNYGNYTDNNKNKAIGGAIGFLPFSNSSLELNVSGQYTPKTGDAGSAFENISNTALAASINYYHVFNPIMVRLQGQYEHTQTQNFNLYTDASETTLLVPQFNNVMSGWYLGATVRASGSENVFISNLELGGRIGTLTLPQNAMWGGNQMNQTTVCLTYWFTWKTPLNIAYDVYTQSGSPTQTALTIRGMWFF